jgi:hypothetical protein
MKVLLEIQDKKGSSLLEILKALPFVKTKPLSDKNGLLIEELHQAVHNMNLVLKGKLKGKPLSDLLDEL